MGISLGLILDMDISHGGLAAARWEAENEVVGCLPSPPLAVSCAGEEKEGVVEIGGEVNMAEGPVLLDSEVSMNCRIAVAAAVI